MRSAKTSSPAMRRIQTLLLTASLLIFAVHAAAQGTDAGGKPQDINSAVPQGQPFTYQGRLSDGSGAASGLYDLQFKLYDALSNGSQVPAANPTTVEVTGVQVTNGIFTVQLDFGSASFDGSARYLEVAVRHSSANEQYTALSPRQPINWTPYAIRSNSAKLADTANTANTASTASTLNGFSDADFVKTGDTRLTDARSPTAGSTNYIQNGPATQTGASFSIDGGGTLGGTLSAATVNSASSYNISGQPVLRAAASSTSVGLAAGAPGNGINNTFVGSSAGTNINSGSANAFFGTISGAANTTGSGNSFFGAFSGTSSTTGQDNSFFGRNAGLLNTTGGSNAFFGEGSGRQNTQGLENAFFGRSSGYSNTTGYANAYFGFQAGYTSTTGTSNSFFGYKAGVNSSASGGSFFGGGAGFSNSTGDQNSFFGVSAGGSNTTGSYNTFFGGFAGQSNSTASANAFFGHSAGRSNTTGTNNSFFGNGAGLGNITGNDNSFFGKSAGLNSTGNYNTFVGSFAGEATTTGTENVFLGYRAGNATTTGGSNVFLGSQAGLKHTSGVGNILIGQNAGSNIKSGSSNIIIGRSSGLALGVLANENGITLIGDAADTSTGISNATAIGASAHVTQSDSLVLGASNVSVGIGVTAPVSKLQVAGGNVYVSDAAKGVILKSPNGSVCRLLTIDNNGALSLSAIACP